MFTDDSLNTFLKHSLYRHDCPSTMTLGDYHAHFLDAESHDAVATHVAGCMLCEEELGRLDAMQSSEHGSVTDNWHRGNGFGWVSSLKRIVVQLLDPPRYEMQLSAVKSQSNAELPQYHVMLNPEEASGMDVEVIARVTPDGQKQLTVRARRPEAWPDFSGTTVRIALASYEAEATTDATGQVIFSDIPYESLTTALISIQHAGS